MRLWEHAYIDPNVSSRIIRWRDDHFTHCKVCSVAHRVNGWPVSRTLCPEGLRLQDAVTQRMAAR